MVEDAQHTGRVREVYPTPESGAESDDKDPQEGFMDQLVRKALE